MASYKDAFEADTFAAGTFACGAWRGNGVVVPDVPGAEYVLPGTRLHYTLDGNRPHYVLPSTRPHYEAGEEHE